MKNWNRKSKLYESEREKTSKSIKKSLSFEKSGETFSIEICLENVSQDKNTIISFLDTLYERIKKEIKF